ncbi:dTMP kinase [Micromonospora sp. NPDC006766]|uniref:dTMP kinase n=1 Tax=Micromonospora sp. NPDC006766 TaxID=3154778 RepID=UPI0033CB821A
MGVRSGFVVALEGQSGVGKSTAARLVCEGLQRLGRKTLLTRTPSTSKIGTMARGGTADLRGLELTLLVAADRYHHERTVVRPAVADGAIVVCDRYLASSLVLDPLDGVAPDLVRAIYRGLPPAGLTVVLCGDPQVCAARATARGLYSRFHTPDPRANDRERTAYEAVVEELRRGGCPAITHEIGVATAPAVADDLVELILAHEEAGR